MSDYYEEAGTLTPEAIQRAVDILDSAPVPATGRMFWDGDKVVGVDAKRSAWLAKRCTPRKDKSPKPMFYTSVELRNATDNATGKAVVIPWSVGPYRKPKSE